MAFVDVMTEHVHVKERLWNQGLHALDDSEWCAI